MSTPDRFPLYKHRNGQWAKKVLGKVHYFGIEKDAALHRWLDEREYLKAGRTPPRRTEDSDPAPTIEELGNLYIDRCRKRVADGELEGRSVEDYIQTIKRLISFVGKTARPEKWEPRNFAELKERFAEPVRRPRKGAGRGKRGTKGNEVKRRAPTTVAGDIRRTRAFLNWCSDSLLIPPCRYGKEFSPISQKALRRQKAKAGPRDLSADDLRKIIAKCPKHFLPVVLLGINGAMGSLDIALMRMSDIPEELDTEQEVWIDVPRNKTGAPRRFLLWSETKRALAEYIKTRPQPAGLARADRRLLLTRTGLEWAKSDSKERKDSAGKAFLSVRRKAGVERGAFYDLRRTFATIAAETCDFPAVARVMGHTAQASNMQSTYAQTISDERIRKVCNFVRQWLFSNCQESCNSETLSDEAEAA